MAEFYLESRTRAGAYLMTLPFRDLQGEWFLSKPCQLRWSMPFRTDGLTTSNFYPGKTEIWLWRDGVKIFAGPLWDANPSSGDGQMSCASESIDSYLAFRRIVADTNFTNASRSDIAWNLINASQALTDGALNITRGTTIVTPNLTVKYKSAEGKYIYDAITDFAEDAYGFEWNIDPDRKFNTYSKGAGTPSRIRLEYGGNVNSYSIQAMGKWARNDILVLGHQSVVSQPVIDTAKRAEYGLRHLVESNTGLTTQTQLNGYAQRLLYMHRDTRYVPQLTVRSDSVNPFKGDITYLATAPIQINDYWVQIDQVMQCSGWQLTVGKNGQETFNLYMQDLREVA